MTKTKIAPEFTRNRDFLSRYNILDPDDLNLATVWSMGTWTFSPACKWPATFPYLYVTGPAGSGKSVFGQDSMGAICRRHKNATGATGPTLFRMLGIYDEETGEIENFAPTLACDEIDATFSGQKDEGLRQALNVGYKLSGSTIPRASGKSSIDFPVYGPKLLIGIDNGHLPETVTQRSIRIDMHKRSQGELDAAGIQPFYSWDVDDEAAEIQQSLSDWAKEHSMVLRDYRPKAPEGLTARQWEIGRTLVQLAHAIGNEAEIVESLLTVMNRNPEKPDRKVTLYRSIYTLFGMGDTDRVTTRQILAQLKTDGVRVPGDNGKGLSAVLSEDGITPDHIRLRPDHPGFVDDKPIQRGYFRHKFDGAFIRFLAPDDDE